MRPLLFLLLLALTSAVRAQQYILPSPDGHLRAEVNVAGNIHFRIVHRGRILLHSRPIGLDLGGKRPLGQMELVRDAQTGEIDREVRPQVAIKEAVVKERCNTLSIRLGSGATLEFRAYDDGIAYRIAMDTASALRIRDELMGFELTGDPESWFPREGSFFSHNERAYKRPFNQDIAKGQRASLPVLWRWGKGPFMLYTETDVRDYPGMYVRSTGRGGFEGVFPKRPSSSIYLPDRWVPTFIPSRFIAKTDGKRSLPWRVFIVADSEAGLMQSQLPFLLGQAPDALDDFSWVRPGKVAWDWWNALRLEGVPFKPGINMQTYKHYIDFAAEHGLEYVILDEGWSKTTDLLKLKGDLSIAELVKYGEAKGVGIILWAVWRTLDKQFDEAFEQFHRWGIKGVKVDFMQRSDQKMTDFYWRTAQEAARRKMLVDFHGGPGPKGLHRTYPNVLTFEAVRGLEWNKWSSRLTPEHDLTLPFTRMVAGPMDYTPGAMRNVANPKKHRVRFNKPMSIGTRCHELAKYVIFESPLQMLADAPTAYQQEPVSMKFLRQVPTVWDQTVVLSASIGHHAIVARRSGDRWFIGGMAGPEGYIASIDLSFLQSGSWAMDIWRDGDNTWADGTQTAHFSESGITPALKYAVAMNEGGGWVALLTKEK